ncbi:myosin regulatory light chain 2, ventricular/cardiac muscle isoform isoform X2 [Dendropsophus ebraccatus]|uniref:myosin regulatory light chain 2, ventricular/cardiac muscle isoform isoform X2 n=1 Tax=Dendropsophus ebraccatus TaxID=150705 RepID=UPI003832176C
MCGIIGSLIYPAILPYSCSNSIRIYCPSVARKTHTHSIHFALLFIFILQGRLNVKNEELEEMLKEAPGPINFTVFLTMFGEKLKGADPEETILNAFKVFDPEGSGLLKSDYIREMLMTQAERFSSEEVDQMFTAFPPDVTGNLNYKNLVHIITHGEEKEE